MAQEERNMDKKKDALEQRLAEDFKKLAEEEEQNIEKHKSEDDIQMPEGSKEAIRAKLDDEIEKIKQAEKEELYRRLSEEDRRALELGRKAMQEEEERKIKRRRKPWKLYFAVAALVAAICGVSANAFGVQERMVTMMKSLVGDREIEQVDSSDENLVIVEEDEEEAYQKVKDDFGIEPVKIFDRPEGMKFLRIVMDAEFQSAEFFYELEGNTIIYLINSSYSNSSYGIDVEDEIIDHYIVETKACSIEVKEYSTLDNGENRYSAQYTYRGLEYFLVGTMKKEQFEEIINNLFY